ncbi:hypothetical protein RSAG8_03211, partial [Rhizoctonia solani AG-8 WAC10335]
MAIPKRRKKPKTTINQLPPEVLSYIILIGAESDRRVWRWGSSGMKSQRIALQVCRYWRDVATSTLALWTFVYVRGAVVSSQNASDLAHAGPTALLDIAIEMHRDLVFAPHELIFLSTQEFAKLTTLTITSYRLDPPELSTILLSNPQLESLRLYDGPCREAPDHDQIDFHRMSRTSAPSLRSLFIQTTNNNSWALQIAIVIQAPGLTHFAFECGAKYPDKHRLVAYITTGVRSANATKSDSVGVPIYPSLQSLDVRRFLCQKKHFTDLISSFPHLTCLTACADKVQWLDATPWVLPKLQYLGLPDLPANHHVVQGLLSRRADIDIPIKEVEAKGGCLRMGTAQHKPLNLEFCPSVALKYEYYRGDDTTVGSLQSLRWISPRMPRL